MLWCLAAAGCGMHRPMHTSSQVLMGTVVEVISPYEDAGLIVFQEMKRVEQVLSYFDQHSELSRLNANGRVQAGEDLRFVLDKARQMWEQSEGAFDVSVAPLSDAWGFKGAAPEVPDDAQIKHALSLVGMDKVEVQPDGTVAFSAGGMKIDLGGIAKGYAIDQAVAKLKERGIDSCLINCGGQVYGLGTKNSGAWKAAIRGARSERLRGRVALRDQSASTSGDYEQFFVRGKTRYAHILDPVTGYPARSGIIAVTVVAPSALTADALSTAVFILGPEKGRKLVAKFQGAQIEDMQYDD